MLNRRLLRVRAMQALYAYKMAEKANLQLAKDYIQAAFAPDLNSMEVQDKVKLKAQAEAGNQLLTKSLQTTPADDQPLPDATDQKVIRVVNEARNLYRNKNKTDRQTIKRRIVAEAELVYDCYLQLLDLYVELAQRAADDKRFEEPTRLSDNAIIQDLAANDDFKNLRLRRNANWDDEQPLVTKIYRDVLKKNNRYLEYCQKPNHTPEEDLALLKYMLKNIFLKQEDIFDYFEKKNIYWTDDIETLRAMVMHTLQPYLTSGHVVIEKLDENWEEGRDFMENIFNETVEQNDELTDLMVPKLKNWEVDRVAEIDKILIKMGLVELMDYPFIPVKVTINEIIEIAKNYSSEKSGTFINGVLDALAKELQQAGKIRKSGRGMLDNK